MADEITLDDLKRRQQDMTTRIAGLVREKDARKIQEAADALQREGAELERLAKAYQAQEIAKHGGGSRGGTEVVLTPAHRERVRAETGIIMESIFIRDDIGVTMRTMPHTDPRAIEQLALEEARRQKVAAEAAARLRAELDVTVARIEAASPAAARKLEELRADPNFLGGMLKR